MLTVRPYQEKDYTEVRQILEQTELFDQIWDSAENLRGLIQQEPVSLLVGEVDGEIVAQIYIIRFGSQVAQLYRLAVRPAYQKQGIATQLLRQVEEQLKGQGVLEVGLFMAANKAELKDFYTKRGFGGDETAWIYRWKKL